VDGAATPAVLQFQMLSCASGLRSEGGLELRLAGGLAVVVGSNAPAESHLRRRLSVVVFAGFAAGEVLGLNNSVGLSVAVIVDSTVVRTIPSGSPCAGAHTPRAHPSLPCRDG
jgi:hypothetical protein